MELESSYLGDNDTMVEWDGKSKDGNYVGSGIYIITAYHTDGGNSVSKIAVIRE